MHIEDLMHIEDKWHREFWTLYHRDLKAVTESMRRHGQQLVREDEEGKLRVYDKASREYLARYAVTSALRKALRALEVQLASSSAAASHVVMPSTINENKQFGGKDD